MTEAPDPGAAFEAGEYAGRIRGVRAAMAARRMDALLLTSPENIYYLAGLNHYGYFATTLLLVTARGPLRIVARAMEAPTLQAQLPESVHVTYGDGDDPGEVAASLVASSVSAGATVGVEEQSMYLPVRVWQVLQQRLPFVSWQDATPLLGAQRAVKSAAEVRQVRTAAAMSDQAIQAGIATVHAGSSEREAAAAIYQRLVLAGSDVPAFPPFVRSGDAIPQEHVTWRDRILRVGDRVLFELGASSARYHAPTSRIVYVGEKPDGVDAAADVVLAGFDALCASLSPGTRAGEVYAAWHRAVSDGLGHDGYHRHHCGYLTGLGFPPSWTGGSSVTGLRRDSDVVIREGMVFHVMSWVLGQGPVDYGVSDTAVVTAHGCEVLTSTPRTPQVS